MPKPTPYKAGAEAAKALLDLIASTGDVTDEFWEDPFVIGFLFYYIHAVAVRAGAQPGDYEGMPSAYIELCGEDRGIDVLQHTMAFSTEHSPGYYKGLEAGDKYLAVIYGSIQYDDDPTVIEARELAAKTAEDLPPGDGVELVDVENTYLLETIFLSEVRRRLNLVTIN